MTGGVRPPNIVLVFADDMGYGDVGRFGSTVIRTPHIDRVAERGVTFTQMVAAAPICTPSRCGLLTGRYPQRLGLPRVLFPHDTDGLPAGVTTLPGLLRDAGYATCCIGKWHLGCLPEHNPVHHGFDRFTGLLYSNDMEPLALYRDTEAVPGEVDQASLTRVYHQEAVRFAREHADRPFLVYLAHTMPHIPLHVEEDFRGRSRAGTYGDTIECIDHYAGQLTAELDELGVLDDTVLIVTSDNGPWFEGSVGGLRGRKFDVYEGGVRVPFVAQWPAMIPAGVTAEQPACLIDLLPTLCACAGVDPTRYASVDGIDLSPVLFGQTAPERGPIFYYDHDCLSAVRRGRWKLHVARDRGRDRREMPQLYDLDADPGESYSLAAAHPDLVEELSRLMEDFDAQVMGDRVGGQSHG